MQLKYAFSRSYKATCFFKVILIEYWYVSTYVNTVFTINAHETREYRYKRVWTIGNGNIGKVNISLLVEYTTSIIISMQWVSGQLTKKPTHPNKNWSTPQILG